jgi:hypothetical protein
MMIVKASKDSEAGAMPEQKLLADMMKFNEEMVKAGVMLAGEGLHPSSKGARIKFSGPNRSVVRGPFTLTNDLIAGYWMIETKSMDEAIAWARRAPNPMPGESEIELRQVFEADDFGAELTPELREKEKQMREKVASKH